MAILMTSAVAGIFYAKNQLREMEDERKRSLMDAMSREVDAVADELGLCAVSKAHGTLSTWDEFPINESLISERFSASMGSYISHSFPRAKEKWTVIVLNWTGGLFFVERSTSDIVPSDSTVPAKYESDGSSMQYDQLAGASTDSIGIRTVNPYYVAVGNFTVKVQTHETTLSRSTAFQRPVVSALPFIESKLRAFETASSGQASDISALVGYMLTTLAQIRVLEGYGQPMYGCEKNTSSILTEEDVYRAVAVALLLEQVRLLRDVDESFAGEVLRICGGEPGLNALLGSKGRSLDPAELFLWFIGKTKLGVDSRTMVAEAVFGLSDQIVLKMMEYMGWLGALDALKSVADFAKSSVDAIVSYLTGEDKAKSSVTGWIERSIEVAGCDPETAASVFAPDTDCSIPVAERVYYVEDAYGSLYPVWVGNMTAHVDVPPSDLLQSDTWAEFYSTYKACQGSFRQLASDGLLRFAFDVAACAQIGEDAIVIDPADGKSVFQQLAKGTEDLSITFDPDAVREAGRRLPMFSAQYDLACAFREFVSSRSGEMVDLAPLTDGALDDIAASVLASARYQYIPDLVVPVEQQLEDIVRQDLEHDASWKVQSVLDNTLRSILSLRLLGIADVVDRGVEKADDDFAGPVVDLASSLLVSGVEGFPGIEPLVQATLKSAAREVMSQSALSSHKRSIYLDTRGEFDFWEGDLESAKARGDVLEEHVSVELAGGMPEMQAVPYDSASGYTTLEHLFPIDNLLVQVKRPWDFSRSDAEYPNTHLTAVDSVSVTPYSTQWTVSVLGLVRLRATSNNSDLQSVLSEPAEAVRSLKLELFLPVVVHSSWPLHDVEYDPSNTLVSDALDAARKFVEFVWDKLEPVVGWIKDGLEQLIKLVREVFETVASFATKVVKAVASVLQTLVETIQTYVQKIADSALARAVKLFLDLTGRVEVRFSMYGFVIIVQTYLPDLIYRHGRDMLRVTVFTDRLGPGLTFGIRVARLTDGSYDILANSTIALENIVVEVAVDPLMHILRRFVEAHCTAPRWRLDLVIPEVEPYETAEVSTADIPGVGALLSNIPIPVLGLSASIELGIRLKYSSPFPTDVVINEVEANPQGDDSGNEWVELYNPLSEPRCIDGWTLGTAHGKSNAMTLQGSIAPNGVKVFRFPETSIDNGHADDPFNDGDSIILTDSAGVTIDSTPMLRDTANDGRTNQRAWDGGPKWVFEQGTMDDSNGLPVLLASSDFIAKALFEAFKQAFLETKLEEVTASLEFVILLSKRVLYHFIENLLAIVKEVIHEIILYVKVGLSDATGAAGAAFRASFVITGEAIVDLLRWLIHTLATFIVNLGRAQCPLAYPAFPVSFFGGLYLRFEALFEVGLPDMIRVLGVVGDIQDTFSCAVCISPNLPALGRLAGRNWGNWSVDFGVYLEGVPRDFASSVLSLDSSDYLDFWLVKARVYGV